MSGCRVRLLLVQHGVAMSKDEDPDRPLRSEGADTVSRMAAWGVEQGLGVDEIRHSGKRRAAETAEILGVHLQPVLGVRVASGLAPLDDVRPVAEALGGEDNTLMLVGHLPFLARLAGFLLTGSPEATPIRFTNAGIVCLKGGQEGWELAWSVPPEL